MRFLNVAFELARFVEVVFLEVCEVNANALVSGDSQLISMERLVPNRGNASFGIGERLEMGGREIEMRKLGDGNRAMAGDELRSDVVGVERTE